MSLYHSHRAMLSLKITGKKPDFFRLPRGRDHSPLSLSHTSDPSQVPMSWVDLQSLNRGDKKNWNNLPSAHLPASCPAFCSVSCKAEPWGLHFPTTLSGWLLTEFSQWETRIRKWACERAEMLGNFFLVASTCHGHLFGSKPGPQQCMAKVAITFFSFLKKPSLALLHISQEVCPAESWSIRCWRHSGSKQHLWVHTLYQILIFSNYDLLFKGDGGKPICSVEGWPWILRQQFIIISRVGKAGTKRTWTVSCKISEDACQAQTLWLLHTFLQAACGQFSPSLCWSYPSSPSWPLSSPLLVPW